MYVRLQGILLIGIVHVTLQCYDYHAYFKLLQVTLQYMFDSTRHNTNNHITNHITVYARIQDILQKVTVQVSLQCMYDYKAYNK